MRLWESGSGSQIALYPNLTANDEEWRKLMRDVRFRRALSLAVDREELNQVVYIGLAKPSNNTIMQRSELFKPEYATKWANYDPKLANKLLDEIGLTKKDSQGIRLLPDGRPATIVVEHASEETEDTDALTLIADNWKKIGIKMLTKPQTRDNFRLRDLLGRGDHDGLRRRRDGGADAQHQPQGVRADHAGRPAMVALGHVRRVQGQAGREVRPRIGLQAARLCEGMGDRRTTRRTAARPGTRSSQPTPTRSSRSAPSTASASRSWSARRSATCPKEGYYAWDPGGYIGLYQPDTFWIAQ